MKPQTTGNIGFFKRRTISEGFLAYLYIRKACAFGKSRVSRFGGVDRVLSSERGEHHVIRLDAYLRKERAT